MLAIAVSGAGGRIGQRLLAVADQDPDIRIAQAIEWEGFPLLGRDINIGLTLAPGTKGVRWTSELVPGADVLLDFSSPENAAKNARLAVAHNIAMLIGTTGLDAKQDEAVQTAARKIPLLRAPNFSLGVNLLFRLAGEAARILGGSYDVEIVEAHHNRKVDAPSGTALGIARSVTEALGRDPQKVLVHGRRGKPGRRQPTEIGMHSLRMGAMAGDHAVHFANDYECLTISHHAESRDVFAAGALRAAKWLHGKKPGLYSLDDMLFGERRI
ncbi:MAG: 4-hydroxy-tetrahydrodipicolinate reductase [Planctomycetota bacterium]|jgi:4-hydroxy-tetrahydrodipicolinate reductase|nr:4-hydroxy-tetrahydrodipicolinate reductase [Planctomycetota bacterium]